MIDPNTQSAAQNVRRALKRSGFAGRIKVRTSKLDSDPAYTVADVTGNPVATARARRILMGAGFECGIDHSGSFHVFA